MRRVAIALTSLLTLVLVAAPALATEEGAQAASESGFGSGQWDGMLLTFAIGIVMGVVVWADSLAAAGNHHDGDTH